MLHKKRGVARDLRLYKTFILLTTKQSKTIPAFSQFKNTGGQTPVRYLFYSKVIRLPKKFVCILFKFPP